MASLTISVLFLAPRLSVVVGSPRGCEKSIPHKILEWSDFFSSTKKYFRFFLEKKLFFGDLGHLMEQNSSLSLN